MIGNKEIALIGGGKRIGGVLRHAQRCIVRQVREERGNCLTARGQHLRIEFDPFVAHFLRARWHHPLYRGVTVGPAIVITALDIDHNLFRRHVVAQHIAAIVVGPEPAIGQEEKINAVA